MYKGGVAGDGTRRGLLADGLEARAVQGPAPGACRHTENAVLNIRGAGGSGSRSEAR